MPELAEQPLGDGVVAPLAVPHATLVARQRWIPKVTPSNPRRTAWSAASERAKFAIGSSPRRRMVASDGGST